MTGAPRRILAVNPNTSEAVTQAFVAAARDVAPDGVEVDGVTGRFGARIVSTAAENLIAGHSALDLVAKHGAGYDGVILAISFDTALTELRGLLNVPVVGITEAAVISARADGRRIGAAIFGAVSQPLYEAVIAQHLEGAVFEVVEISSAADYLAPAAHDDAVIAAVGRLAERGAEAVVLCGTAIAGMAARLSPRAEVPLHDGTAALPMVLQAIEQNRPANRPIAPLGETVGLSPELAAFLKGDRHW